MAAGSPSAHHGVGHFRVELDGIGARTVAERLDRKYLAFRDQRGAARQVEAFAVPLIDVIGPVAAHGPAEVRRPDRVIADFDLALGMKIHPPTELPDQKLCTEANPQ